MVIQNWVVFVGVILSPGCGTVCPRTVWLTSHASNATPAVKAVAWQRRCVSLLRNGSRVFILLVGSLFILTCNALASVVWLLILMLRAARQSRAPERSRPFRVEAQGEAALV